MYVIKRLEDGAFVAPAGGKGSYTMLPQNARTWASREAAEKDRCGNEIVVEAASALRPADV